MQQSENINEYEINPFVCLDRDPERWRKEFEGQVDWQEYDRIVMTQEEMSLLFANVNLGLEDISDLTLNPALPEFSLILKPTMYNHQNITCFKKSKLQYTKTHKPAKNVVFSTTPLVEAFVHFGSQAKAPDLVVSICHSVFKVDEQECALTFGFSLVTGATPETQITDMAGRPVDVSELSDEIKGHYIITQYALRHRPTVFSVVTENVVVKIPRKHGGKSRRKVKAVRVLRIDPEQLHSSSHEPRKIGCPCWGVMGHYRMTKSNKQVWIKPHLKGKHRDNPDAYQAKQYVIQAGGME
ncbi:MAG: hypothetical protein EOM48_13415 [Bacilli bacterium]|nr:hypothetical protein [Bacilli bacterium]